MESQGADAELLPLPDFLSASWRLFKSRWTVVITIAALGAAATLAGAIIPAACAVVLWGHVPTTELLGAAAVVAVCAMLWFSSWTPIAMFEAVLDESATPPDVWTCARKSARKVVPFTWIYVLFFVLVFSGFCLFLVPGVYLAISLSLACLICVAEGDSGMAALEKSVYYVHAHWWQTFLRLVIIGLISMAFGLIPIVGWIAGAIFSPLPLAMAAILYKDLKRARQAQGRPLIPSWRTRALIASSLLGLILPLIGALALYKVARQDSGFSLERQWSAALQKMEQESAPPPLTIPGR